ncbi:SpoIIE family protein phosphatase [Streptomyces sannanensis]
MALAVLLIFATLVGLVLQARHEIVRDARNQTLAVATAFASAPGTAAAMTSAHPTAVLEPRVLAAQKASGVDAVVAFSPSGIRYAHPDPRLIGKHLVGAVPKLDKPITETTNTSVGPSVITVAPVTTADGKVVGGVGAGIKVGNVNDVLYQRLPVLLIASGVAVVLATSSAALVSRRLRRQTHGLGPAAVTRMYEHHDAVLHSVREGVLIVGGDGRLLLANDEARRLVELPPDAEQRHVTELGLDTGLAELLTSGRAATDEVCPAGDRLLGVNVRPTEGEGGPLGCVATLRDATELRALSDRAETARTRLQLLYDAGVRIGTTLNVVRTAEELAQVVVGRFADFVSVELLDPVLHGGEPSGTAGMHRTALRGVGPDPPLYPVGTPLTWLPSTPMAAGLAAGHAVLEPDLAGAPGWRAQDPALTAKILEYGFHSLITAPLQARGVTLGMVNYWRAQTPEPFGEEDVSFAEELAGRAAVSIDNARRYTREHTMAVTLQRSLLPRGLPEQSALDVAYRYLPAQAGVGGDWFDVIPLPGARVALVVGDVVGQGLHAAATMGRLRTAVHNFSGLDLPPDELLAHLDELVTGIDQEEAGGDNGSSVTGATCLYAIYDSVAGLCTVARAGHPGPALIRPDGSVDFPEVPASPPLGLGGGPFETAELRLPEGSGLVLFTDGLVRDRGRDIDTGLDLLRAALAGRADGTPEELCQAVVDTVLPARPSDDIALLVARTRLLDPAQVVGWDVPSDPAAVAPVRAACGRQLEVWGLDEIGFATELILSELITNAIRYGTEPIRVRMMHDRTLICEVSDSSSTSPHMRRAATTDEGGRGLFLVARFASRWGTRYTSGGKVIWTEQALHNGAGEPGADLGDILLGEWDDVAL